MPGPATKPGLGRRPLKDRPAPQPPEAKDAKDKRPGRKKAEDGYKKASDRAYKAFNQVRAGVELETKVHTKLNGECPY